MNIGKLELIRDISIEECPWLQDDLFKGMTVYEYTGCTYGCITRKGIAVTEEDNGTPFFEVPINAIYKEKE